jgi:predicted CoA-binding protein
MNDENTPSNPTDEVVRDLLTSMSRVAVVGLSSREDRASNGIARFLVGQGIEVLGVNPMQTEPVHGVPMFAGLPNVSGSIDVVDVFRRSEAVPAIAEAAIAMGAKALWLQEGIVHEKSATKAREAGLIVIQDRCLYKEWLRLMNG